MRLSKSDRHLWEGLVVIVFVYLTLSIKNPLTPTSIIPNLEPYPDSFYYAQPAWNFVHGAGFTMDYLGHKVQTIVPPLYSYFLIPFFGAFGDVRSFYLVNMLLMTGSVGLLWMTLRRLFDSKTSFLAMIVATMFFITNFYMYTLPSLLIAEVLSLFLVAAALYLLIRDVTPTTIAVASSLGALLWFTKFSNFPLGAVFYVLYSYKIVRALTSNKLRLIYFALTIFWSTVFLLYFFFGDRDTAQVSLTTAGFTAASFTDNLVFYTRVLLGGQTRFLWFSHRLISPLVAILAAVGLIHALRSEKYRTFGAYILTINLSLVIFMSFFYATDARYVVVLLPSMSLGAAFAINALPKRKEMLIIMGLVIIYFFAPFIGQDGKKPIAVSLARQAAANVRGNETAWYFVAITEFNKFFESPQYQGSYLGTFLPPYLVEYYTNHRYHYLPLSKSQDFFTEKGKLSSAMGIDTIEAYYTRLLTQGKRIFVSNAFAGNKKEWGDEFETLKAKFNARLVKEGCLDTCNIYELRLE